MPPDSVELPDFDGLWNYDDPACTELRFRELLPRAEQGADRSSHAQLLTQIARTQGLQRKFAELSRAPWLVEQEPARIERLKILGAGVTW